MKKIKYLTEIQKRLPTEIIVQDETIFDFTEDEFISVLCWIKYFKNHYKEHGKNKLPYTIKPLISKRMRLDFGLYISPCSLETNFGKNIIYISTNEKGGTLKNSTLKSFIVKWGI